MNIHLNQRKFPKMRLNQKNQEMTKNHLVVKKNPMMMKKKIAPSQNYVKRVDMIMKISKTKLKNQTTTKIKKNHMKILNLKANHFSKSQKQILFKLSLNLLENQKITKNIVQQIKKKLMKNNLLFLKVNSNYHQKLSIRNYCL